MKVVLVAASGLASEALSVLRSAGGVEEVRILDDNPATWGTRIDDEPVEGGLDLVGQYDDHELIVCAGRGAARRSLVARLGELGVGPRRFADVVHSSVDVPQSCTLGHGSIVLAHVALTANVKIGNHVVVMPNATLTHDDTLEDFTTICAGVALGGRVRVGSGAYLGMNASVREGLSVGAGAVLGMGAVLLEDLPAGETWVGTPARPIPAAGAGRVF